MLRLKRTDCLAFPRLWIEVIFRSVLSFRLSSGGKAVRIQCSPPRGNGRYRGKEATNFKTAAAASASVSPVMQMGWGKRQ